MKKYLKQNLRTILLILVPLLLVSMLSTYIVASVEKTTNQLWGDPGNALWWWLITISTIGYGDMVPSTYIGRFFGSIVVLSGIVFFGTIVSELGILLKALSQREHLGLKVIKDKNHVVILGDNPLLSSLILNVRKINDDKKIVVVTHMLESRPFEDISFVKGDPRYRETLERANIKEASLAIILADDHVNNPDAYSIIIGNELEEINPKLLKIAEITDGKWETIFKQSGIDVFVSEKKFLKSIHNSSHNQVYDILSNVMERAKDKGES